MEKIINILFKFFLYFLPSGIPPIIHIKEPKTVPYTLFVILSFFFLTMLSFGKIILLCSYFRNICYHSAKSANPT